MLKSHLPLRPWDLSLMLCLGLNLTIGLTAARPALAEDMNAAVGKYYERLQQVGQAVDAYDYPLAIRRLREALPLYDTALQAMQNCDCDQSDLPAARALLQIRYLNFSAALGRILQDEKKHELARQVFELGLSLYPETPCLHYLNAGAQLALDQQAAAVVELYETLRLARFPSRSGLVSSLSEDDSFDCDPETILLMSARKLEQLEQPLRYPLALDLVTDIPMPGRIVPGLGVNVVSGDRVADVFFGDRADEVEARLGEPKSRPMLAFGGRPKPYLNYGDTLIGLDPDSSEVVSFYLTKPGLPVLLPKGYVRTGGSVTGLQTLLQDDYGLEVNHNPFAKDIKEVFEYPQLGLIAHIDQQDRIALIALQRPE